MSLEERRQIALSFVELMPRGRVAELPLSPNFEGGWSTLSGNIPADEYVERTGVLPLMFTEPLSITPQAVVAEDNHVAVQASSEGTLVNGTPYDNQYVFLIRFDDANRIVRIFEYMNVDKARVMFPVLQEIRAQLPR